jgi:hypothetical protein
MLRLFHSITGRNLPKEAWADKEDLVKTVIPVSGHRKATAPNAQGQSEQ